jgi:hypothetical protein
MQKDNKSEVPAEKATLEDYVAYYNERFGTSRYAQLHDKIFGKEWWCYNCQQIIPHPLADFACPVCGCTDHCIAHNGHGDNYERPHWEDSYLWYDPEEGIPVKKREKNRIKVPKYKRSR